MANPSFQGTVFRRRSAAYSRPLNLNVRPHPHQRVNASADLAIRHDLERPSQCIEVGFRRYRPWGYAKSVYCAAAICSQLFILGTQTVNLCAKLLRVACVFARFAGRNVKIIHVCFLSGPPGAELIIRADLRQKRRRPLNSNVMPLITNQPNWEPSRRWEPPSTAPHSPAGLQPRRTAWELCAAPTTRVTQSNPRRGGIRVVRWPRPVTDHSAAALVTTKANRPPVGVHASAIKANCHAYAVHPVETQLQASSVSAALAHAAFQLVSKPAGKPAGPSTSVVAFRRVALPQPNCSIYEYRRHYKRNKEPLHVAVS